MFGLRPEDVVVLRRPKQYFFFLRPGMNLSLLSAELNKDGYILQDEKMPCD